MPNYSIEIQGKGQSEQTIETGDTLLFVCEFFTHGGHELIAEYKSQNTFSSGFQIVSLVQTDNNNNLI